MAESFWRIYYGDGTTFSSEEGDPSDAPCVNIIAIVQQDINDEGDHYWVLLAGSVNPMGHHFDWYWRCDPDGRGEFWWAGTQDGFMDQAMRLGAHSPKQGRTLHNDLYSAILNRAIDEKAKLEGVA